MMNHDSRENIWFQELVQLGRARWGNGLSGQKNYLVIFNTTEEIQLIKDVNIFGNYISLINTTAIKVKASSVAIPRDFLC